MVASFRSYSIQCLALIGLQTLLIAPAEATLKFYYDPATGNVSFDTSETRTGAVYSYNFGVRNFHFLEYHNLPIPVLRFENHIRLSTSTLYLSEDFQISEGTFAEPWRGLYTIGDILPPGFSEEFWKTSFLRSSTATHKDPNYKNRTEPYYYAYSDAIGMGPGPNAEFIYGRPDREFDNRWDLVEPTTLTWAKHATLVYRVWSGEVLIDTTGPTGGYISSMHLESNSRFLPAGYTPIVDSPFNQAHDSAVFYRADALEPGRYSIGKILPAGLTRAEFEGVFIDARFIGRAGFNGGSFDFDVDGVAMTLRFVPEPASWVLALFAVAIIYGPRRGRS